ncbi:MAG: hypothetical protein QOF02_4114 [Blastocatellia bacterium]|jgi:hypothetical protein|nr:hypothetical protein [Blastocatellia bacterium]
MTRINIKCAFALVLMLACSFSVAEAAKKKTKAVRPTYGRVEVTSNPAGYPILVNGKQVATTATDSASAQPIDLQPGTYTIEVLFPNKTHKQVVDVVAGKRHCICLSYTKRVITRPCPYPVNVSAPTSVAEGDLITFSSDVSYGGSSALNYTWTISPAGAKIVRGSGTPTITVDTSGLGGQPVSAIIVVDDGSGDRSCRQSARATTDVIKPPEAVIFDRVPPVTYDDLKARLDNLAIELQNTPTAQGYIFVYTAPSSRPGQYERLSKRVSDYLTQKRQIDSSRLVILNGGNRETDFYEFWIVPQGARPPQATPGVSSNYTPTTETPTDTRRTRRTRRDD